MPRYREPFTVFPRKLASGKTVYYFRTYAPSGKRTTAHSTGKTNKTQARNYCADLLAKGLLYSNTGMTFGVYANGFFNDDSQWFIDKIQSRKGSEQAVALNTIKNYRYCLSNHLLPFFSSYKLMDIKPSDIKDFRDYLIKQDFSNSVINTNCSVLKIIFKYALADRLMNFNPFASIQGMYQNARVRASFSVEELDKILKKHWRKPERKIFVLTAALTGMRISEICAIRKDTLFDDYIDVRDQRIDEDLLPVKDGEKRKVRICPELRELIEECIDKTGNFAFEDIQNTYRRSFYENLGISKKEREERGLSFHSLRHFLNTYLISNGIPEIKVKSVLGHSSGKGSMTERYTNFEPEHFDDVAALQEKLLLLFLG